MEIKDIYDLIDKIEKSSFSEVKIIHNDVEVKLKRGFSTPHESMVQHIKPVHSAQPDTAASAQPASSAQVPQTGGTPGIETVKAPIVGTFYRAPAPDAPPFVNIGQNVAKGQTLCILEAMKVMNELEADFDCEIVKVLIENGTLVEYGTPLFEVKLS